MNSFVRAGTIAISLVLAAPVLAAQQTQGDVHASYSVGTTTHSASWGGGLGAQTTFGSEAAPVKFNIEPAVDYLKQEKSGPSQTSLALSAALQFGGKSTVNPYVGASAGATWSGGSAKQWDGARLGLESTVGAQVQLGASGSSAKVEESFGYVRGQEHSLGTSVGLLFSF